MEAPTLRRTARWALLGLVPAASFFAYRWSDHRWRPEIPVAEVVRARQTEALGLLVEAADRGRLLTFEQALLVVDQSLIQDLLSAAMPLEGPVGGFQVRIESATASFDGGLALIHLNGRATLVESSVTAELRVYAGLDVQDLDPDNGLLRCRVQVFGVETPQANLLGLDEPLRGLTAALTEGGLAALLPFVEIPVRVDDHIALPAVDSKRFDLLEAQVPIRAEVAEVKVFGGRLWVSLVTRSAAPEPGLGAPPENPE